MNIDYFLRHNDMNKSNAIILAAGFGMRMVPINREVPKALLEVNGERLIERIIKQLHEVGIMEIYIVVGFMKEQFEYLQKEYGVELIVNDEYFLKNNLYSLSLVSNHIFNTYIIPCDIWCKRNPFHKHEKFSWYMVSDIVDNESSVRINRNLELIKVSPAIGGNSMIGICFLKEKQAKIVRNKISDYSADPRYDNAFWEEALYEKNKMIVSARIMRASNVSEINTYEQLRALDCNSNHLKSDSIFLISHIFNVPPAEVKDISVLKKGMTNRSFLFKCKNRKFIMRIPGEGTNLLINREQEAQVYQVIKGNKISDDVVYINPQNGYKITAYWENSRVCNPNSYDDVKKCMALLRRFHEKKLKVAHIFDIFGQIGFYESLWNGAQSIYKDYNITKSNVFSLREYIELYAEDYTLTHIDSVPDNFLFIQNKGIEEVHLIDWEYAGMQDPHVDIAMFCIYALYNKRQVDRVIRLYFINGCSDTTRIKIYCYIAVCGLLWSNWCEYKRLLGVEFGEYALRQYQYAKKYYKIVQKELRNLKLEVESSKNV